jgi:hypothetical protein
MSAVSRALNVEVPTRWAENQLEPARPVSRWGEPIWAADEPVLKLQNTISDRLPLEITLLAFLYSER